MTGLAECHCIPGHRSTHLTHACIDCGLPDYAVAQGEPIPPCPGPSPLIVMACSATKTKTKTAGLVPALERYDGPMWRSLRAAIKATDKPLAVWFLSARHGFCPATMGIEDYNHRMDETRATALSWTSSAAELSEAVAASPRVLFAGGAMYRNAMVMACRDMPLSDFLAKVKETRGAIGEQRHQVHEWVQALP